jgi:hypothetical protein
MCTERIYARKEPTIKPLKTPDCDFRAPRGTDRALTWYTFTAYPQHHCPRVNITEYSSLQVFFRAKLRYVITANAQLRLHKCFH